MKRLYNINKVIIIINLILAFIPFIGLLFMVITGITQVISYIIYLTKWRHIDTKLRNYFIAYPFLVAIVLSIISIGKDISFVISLSIAALIAIGFLFLIKKQKDIFSKPSSNEL